MAGIVIQPNFPSVPSMTAEAQDFVEQLLTDSRAAAADAVDVANAAIAALAEATMPDDVPSPPSPPTLITKIESGLGAVFEETPDLGEIDVQVPSAFTPDDITIPDILTDIPEYASVVSALELPSAPEPLAVTVPSPPTIDTTLTVPDEPAPNYGDIPDLLPITLPVYTAPVLEDFTDDVPTFSAQVPSSAIDWTEPQYNAWIADRLKSVLEVMLAGGTGIPTAVERAIWDRDRARLDVAARATIEDAAGEFAAKGFDLPGGPFLARVMQAQRENREKVAQASRDVAIKQADLEQTNRQFAVKTGAELENMFVQIFISTTGRSFEIAKYAVEARIQIFNAQVAAFNVEQQVFAQRIERFKAKLQYALAQIDVYKAQLEAERVKGELNKELIASFRAKIEAYQAQVEAYRAVVQAAVARAELQRSRIELFRGQIEGIRAQVDAKKSEYDGFAARVQGEVAKAGLEESNARAYSARVSAITGVAELAVKDVDAQLARSKHRLDAHLGELQRLGQLSGQQLQAIQARGALYDSITRRDSAKFDAERATRQVEIQSQIEMSRNLVAYYEAQGKVWMANVARLTEYAKINASSIQAAAQIAATIAAGSYAGTSVSAAFGGNVSRSETGSQNFSYSESKSESSSESTSVSENHNYEHEA